MSFAGPVLLRLRLATAHVHRALEDRLNAVERLSHADDRQALVSRYYRMHASAERAVDVWLGSVADLDLAARRREPLLVRDMAVLGLIEPSAHTLPPVVIKSVAEALGVLYVLEGSSLGGRVIRKGLEARGASL